MATKSTNPTKGAAARENSLRKIRAIRGPQRESVAVPISVGQTPFSYSPSTTWP